MFNIDDQPPERLKEGNILVGERKMTLSKFFIDYNALIILVLLIIISAVWSPIFFTRNNLVNVLRQQTSYLVVAVGLLVVMLTGGIDLSVASMVGLGSVMVTELVTMNEWRLVPAILLTLGICLVFGAINGFLVAVLKMAPFIVTLAMSFAVLGVVFIATKGAYRMLSGDDPLIDGFIEFGQGSDPLLGLPWRIYITAVIVIIFWLVLTYTSFGRLTKATGSNALAVKLAGIDIRKYQFFAYVICSFLAGVAGVLVTAASGASSPTTAQADYTMTAIAGVIIGGGDLNGGKGTVPFTVVGVFIMGIIGNIMNLSAVPAYPQWVVRAIVIVLAIFLRSVVSSRNTR